MIIKKISVNEIKAAAYNPRQDLQPGDPDYEKLKKSIREFGMVQLLVWNKQTGNLVGGHQSLKILVDEEKRKEVDVVVVDLDERKEKALNLALNKISGDWDMPKLKDLLEELDVGDFEIEITGFEESEIEDLVTIFGDEYKRPSFQSLLDEFKHDEGKTEKNENWFYVEFYEDDKLFNELTALLEPILKGQHELDGKQFEKIVRSYYESQH